MPTPPLDLDVATDLVEQAQRVIDSAVQELKKLGGPDQYQSLAYDIAHGASAVATARAAMVYGAKGDDESKLAAAFLALVLGDVGIVGRLV
jgi:hypothetical protein